MQSWLVIAVIAFVIVGLKNATGTDPSRDPLLSRFGRKTAQSTSRCFIENLFLPILLFSQQTNVRRSFIMCAVVRIGGFGRVVELTGCRAT